MLPHGQLHENANIFMSKIKSTSNSFYYIQLTRLALQEGKKKFFSNSCSPLTPKATNCDYIRAFLCFSFQISSDNKFLSHVMMFAEREIGIVFVLLWDNQMQFVLCGKRSAQANKSMMNYGSFFIRFLFICLVWPSICCNLMNLWRLSRSAESSLVNTKMTGRILLNLWFEIIMEVKEILSTVNMNTTIDFKKFDSTENQMELQSVYENAMLILIGL